MLSVFLGEVICYTFNVEFLGAEIVKQNLNQQLKDWRDNMFRRKHSISWVGDLILQ